MTAEVNAGEKDCAETLAEAGFTVVEGALERTLTVLLPAEEATMLGDNAAEADSDPSALLRIDNAFKLVVAKPDAPSLGTVIAELPTGTTIGISLVVSVAPGLIVSLQNDTRRDE